MPPRLAQMMKTRTVDRLIDEHLIDKKLAAEKIEVEPKEVDEALAKFKERFPNEAGFKTFLDRNGMSAEEMKENLAKDLKLRALLEDKYGIDVSEEDAKEFYETNKERFKQPEQVHARHVLVKSKEKAAEIAKEAKKPGTDFAKLAKEKSTGPSASKGGDLGFFAAKDMVPEFSKVAFSMKPGEVSDPVKSQFGFHVIKVEGKKEAGTIEYADVKDKIVEQLKRQKYRESMKTLLTELKKDVKIEKHADNIQVNVQAPKPGQGGHPMMGGGKGGMQQLPPELKKKLMERAKQQKQQQQAGGEQGGEQGGNPTELKLQKPKVLDK
jgi:parvulin-like peptidyl-prolyl isomerase